MFDSLTLRVALTSIIVYTILFVMADSWLVARLLAAFLSEEKLERLVRRLMDLETNSRFRHRPRTGMLLLWKFAEDLNTQRCLKVIGGAYSEAERVSAFYLVSQVPEAEDIVRTMVEERPNDPASRVGAAAIQQRQMAAAVGGRPIQITNGQVANREEE
jgi:hypothetical protein